MNLTEIMRAAGVQPARITQAADFFNKHPDLVAEVCEARDQGFGWDQIADELGRSYGWRPNRETLRRFMGSL